MRSSGQPATTLPFYKLASELAQRLSTLQQILPSWSVEQRKALVTLCRAQTFPDHFDYSLRERIRSIDVPHLQQILKSLIPYFESPLTNGLILNMVLAAPMEQSVVHRERTASIMKEMTVMESLALPATIDFSPIFDPTLLDNPLSVTTPPNPIMNQRIHTSIRSWIKRVGQTLHYPHLTKKSVSLDTSQRIKETFSTEFLPSEITGTTLEQIYIDTGEWFGGACGMRQKWYPSGITPRTYYAAGGDTLQASRYLRDIFNTLADTFEPTERYSRVDRFRMRTNDDSEYFFIYDLSSFTSNFHEQRNFLNTLGKFCEGTTIRCFDPFVGVMEKDLGVMILQYNAVCNTFPLYRVETGDIVSREWFLCHGVAGFLGVFGNLMTCTVPHSFVVAQHCKELENLGTAGDDGIVAVKNSIDVVQSIHCLGRFAEDKTYNSNERAVYLKRKFEQVGCTGLVYDFVIWPNFCWLTVDTDLRWTHLRTYSSEKRRRAVASSVFQCMKKLFLYKKGTLDKEIIDVASLIFKVLYQKFQLPFGGNLPQCGGDISLGIVAVLDDCWFVREPLDNLLRHKYNGHCSVTYREKMSEEGVGGIWYEGMTFRGNSNKFRKYCKSVGWIESDKEFVTVLGFEGEEAIKREFSREPLQPAVYSFRVCQNIPTHITILDSGQGVM